MKTIKVNSKNIKFVCNELDHPEGLAFNIQGDLFAGGELGQIYCINVKEGIYECIAQTGGSILGITIDGKGQIYACDCANHQIIRCSPSGVYDVYIKGTDKTRLNNPNFSVFDREGRIFFSESGDFWKPTGRLWIKEPGLPASPLTYPDLNFPNGLYLDSGEKYLYVIFSKAPEIARYKIIKNCVLGKKEIIVKLDHHIVPDGIALDSKRKLWISCYKPDAILKISQKGEIEIVIEDLTGTLLNRPTNLVLKENEILFANLGGRHIGSFEIDVKPLKLNYPVFE